MFEAAHPWEDPGQCVFPGAPGGTDSPASLSPGQAPCPVHLWDSSSGPTSGPGSVSVHPTWVGAWLPWPSARGHQGHDGWGPGSTQWTLQPQTARTCRALCVAPGRGNQRGRARLRHSLATGHMGAGMEQVGVPPKGAPSHPADPVARHGSFSFSFSVCVEDKTQSLVLPPRPATEPPQPFEGDCSSRLCLPLSCFRCVSQRWQWIQSCSHPTTSQACFLHSLKRNLAPPAAARLPPPRWAW